MSLKQVRLTSQFDLTSNQANGVPIQEIETWVEAIAFYDNDEFDSALRTFDNIPDTAKILFNCGVIHATLGEHKRAVGISRPVQVERRSDVVIGPILSASDQSR